MSSVLKPLSVVAQIDPSAFLPLANAVEAFTREAPALDVAQSVEGKQVVVGIARRTQSGKPRRDVGTSPGRLPKGSTYLVGRVPGSTQHVSELAV